jgi:putative transposase
MPCRRVTSSSSPSQVPLLISSQRSCAALLTQAVEAEVAEFLAKHVDPDRDRPAVRRGQGHLPEREIMTGIGPVAVRQPRVRDRAATEGERIRYLPSILPPCARSKSL